MDGTKIGYYAPRKRPMGGKGFGPDQEGKEEEKAKEEEEEEQVEVELLCGDKRQRVVSSYAQY
eukprot:516593-Rhodomonas_salina.1